MNAELTVVNRELTARGPVRPSVYSELSGKAHTYLTTFKECGDVIPSIVGMALHLGVSRETLRQWGKDSRKPEFAELMEAVQCEQERLLLNMGLKGEFNSNIVKLALGKHGYKESQETDHNFHVNIGDKDADGL